MDTGLKTGMKKGSGGDAACVCTHRVSPEELVQVVWMVEPSALNRLATSSFVTWVQAGRGGGERERRGEGTHASAAWVKKRAVASTRARRSQLPC
jgi:hypothetical protein